jgi:hypothetical protein
MRLLAVLMAFPVASMMSDLFFSHDNRFHNSTLYISVNEHPAQNDQGHQ